MIIIGCDFHPSFQQIAVFDPATGATTNHKLMHATGEAERFYRRLTSAGLVGIEAVGNDQWFVQLLRKLDHEVWIGDAAQMLNQGMQIKQKLWSAEGRTALPGSVETRSGRKNHEPAKTSFPSCVEHVVRVTHAKVARNLRSSCDSLQKSLIQSADVVQGSTLKNQ
jgi:membrane peptidoglycan carboxypeptidase